MDKGSTSNSQLEQQAASVYQKLDTAQDTRRQLKLSFPTQLDRKPVPAAKIHPIAPISSRERFKARQAFESGKLQFSSTEIHDFTSDDLLDLGKNPLGSRLAFPRLVLITDRFTGEIGRGAFGSVNKMVFKKTDKIMAVKVNKMLLIKPFYIDPFLENSMLECGGREGTEAYNGSRCNKIKQKDEWYSN